MVVEQQNPSSDTDRVATEKARKVDEALEIEEPLQDPRIATRVIPLIIAFLVAAIIIVVLFVLPR